MKKEQYLLCRKIMKDFIKKEYWTVFSSADIFYVSEGKNKVLFTFVEQFFEDSFGCQLFFNYKGLNYVHDVLTAESPDVVTIYDCDSICAIFVDKCNLKEEEIKFLKDNKIKIMQEKNLFFYRFEQGYKQRLCNDKEIKIYLTYLELISSIISNEYNDIIEAFENTYATVIIMDKQNFEYSIIYRPLPYLETIPRAMKANVEFADEFKNGTYINDDSYFFTSYVPVVVKETNIRPLIIYCYFPKLNRHYFKYLINEPKEYKNLLFGILYDVFTEIGVPVKMIFNNRDIYSLLRKTLDLLNIDNVFLREDYKTDSNVNDFLTKIYQSNQDELVEREDLIKLLLDTTTNTLNELANYDDKENEEEEEFVS